MTRPRARELLLPRVVLSKLTRRDEREFLAAIARSRKLHAKWVAPPSNSRKFAEYLQRLALPDHAGFLIRRAEDDAMVGVINCNNIVRGLFHSAYLGFYAFAPFARGGYMTAGLKLVMRRAFTKLKLHRLEANIQPRNVGSIALVKRCGFRLEGLSPRYLKIAGRWRDHERWAITIEDWRR